MTDHRDRARGVLLASACGDALGVPYEYGPPLADDAVPEMVGRPESDLRPGEYSDDTAMSVCIAEAAARHGGLDEEALDDLARRFLEWGRVGVKHAGRQTKLVFAASSAPTADAMRRAARAVLEEKPHAAGNGALMRTAVVALVRPDDRLGTARSAAEVARLTHPHQESVESCVLWTEAVRRALVGGDIDLVAGLDLLEPTSRSSWRARIEAATGADPGSFTPNGYTVAAMQAAWAAVTSTPGQGAVHLSMSLIAAIRAGGDTDTIAAIAGGLLGARWGASAVPDMWRNAVHGYGGLDGAGLVALADQVLGSTQD
ncbi:ADP-ribosylglycohydrolase family protein [Aeromicrobium phragmitis]|uniref:ADP-ribosylglycohydrolase family protein n=1 Tax=Aeromicrobium phragmitis TaxID=2478914 RepID=A0A3L8PKU6_9ACTN|nr:ADP-ribosylglycohydrolase family protein [Aeromicrobium phragmitis]RLV55860.1 ADP-ribosylglycohydrolase family protein [Aeromicrobium phragmitis]